MYRYVHDSSLFCHLVTSFEPNLFILFYESRIFVSDAHCKALGLRGSPNLSFYLFCIYFYWKFCVNVPRPDEWMNVEILNQMFQIWFENFYRSFLLIVKEAHHRKGLYEGLNVQQCTSIICWLCYTPIWGPCISH